MGRALLEGDREQRPGGQTEAVSRCVRELRGQCTSQSTRAQHQWGADPSPSWGRWAGAKGGGCDCAASN